MTQKIEQFSELLDHDLYMAYAARGLSLSEAKQFAQDYADWLASHAPSEALMSQNDEQVIDWLVKERAFTPKAARKCLTTFKETMKFAGINLPSEAAAQPKKEHVCKPSCHNPCLLDDRDRTQRPLRQRRNHNHQPTPVHHPEEK